MNKKIIIGNFKMNLLPNEVVLYIENLKKDIKSNNEIVLCVPYVDIPYINNNLKNTNIHIGAQNVYFEDNGAYTGEISSKMLKSIGVEYILIGHPERRHIFKENDLIINKKLIKCLNNNLKIILCVENIVQLKKDLEEYKTDLEFVKRMQNETEKMKHGSIALVGQIKTISKIRIYDPKTNFDILSNVKLSSERLDSIDNEIISNFTNNKVDYQRATSITFIDKCI